MNDPHANYSSDWYTPPEVVEWARRTMGGIDLDPCGTDASNRIVKAFRVFGEADNGLAQPWKGRVMCNPPGSNSSKSIAPWWGKSRLEFGNGNISALVWIFFNCESAKSVSPSPFDLPGFLLIPRKRIAFIRDGKRIKSPRQWTWLWSTVRPAPPPVPSWEIQTGA